MAIFFAQNGQPEQFGLAYNDNVWIVETTNYSPTLRFRMALVPINYPVGAAIGQARVYPTPATDNNGNLYYNRAFFDPSRWLQSYIESEVSIPLANHQGFAQRNKMHKEYMFVAQEEELDSNGVYQPGALILSDIKSVWNGVKEEIEWLDFDVNDYLINSYSQAKKFLTNAPRTQKINTGQSAFLYFVANAKFAADRYTIKAYSGLNASGSLLATASVDNPISVAGGWDKMYFSIAVGTYDIVNIAAASMTGSTPSTVLNGAKSYTIQLRDNTNAELSELFTYNIDSVCSKYDPVRLQFLNSMGGFDSFNFNLKSIEEEDIQKASFVKQPREFKSALFNLAASYNYTKGSRGTVDYDIRKTKKLTINTDYLTDEESAWMLELVSSPIVYTEHNNELIAVTCKEKRFKKQTSLNDKLRQYTFDIEYALTNIRQRG